MPRPSIPICLHEWIDQLLSTAGASSLRGVVLSSSTCRNFRFTVEDDAGNTMRRHARMVDDRLYSTRSSPSSAAEARVGHPR